MLHNEMKCTKSRLYSLVCKISQSYLIGYMAKITERYFNGFDSECTERASPELVSWGNIFPPLQDVSFSGKTHLLIR
jgi:hypothetical protein